MRREGAFLFFMSHHFKRRRQKASAPSGASEVQKNMADEKTNVGFFIPLTKVDAVNHEVWGTLAEEAVDQGVGGPKEIMDYGWSKPNFEAWSDRIQKISGGKSLFNVREMHSPSAVGKGISLQFNDAAKNIFVGAKIVDPVAWQKCVEGVYNGFSVGGDYGRREYDSALGAWRYEAKPIEATLADNPAMIGATFTMVKADGTSELRKFAAPAQSESQENEQTELEQLREIAKRQQALLEKIAERTDVTDADKERAAGEAENFADEKNKKYKLDTEEQIRAAWNYIHQERNRSKYSAEDAKTIENKIIAAWKDKIDQDGPPSAQEEKTVANGYLNKAASGDKAENAARLADHLKDAKDDTAHYGAFEPNAEGEHAHGGLPMHSHKMAEKTATAKELKKAARKEKHALKKAAKAERHARFLKKFAVPLKKYKTAKKLRKNLKTLRKLAKRSPHLNRALHRDTLQKTSGASVALSTLAKCYDGYDFPMVMPEPPSYAEQEVHDIMDAIYALGQIADLMADEVDQGEYGETEAAQVKALHSAASTLLQFVEGELQEIEDQLGSSKVMAMAARTGQLQKLAKVGRSISATNAEHVQAIFEHASALHSLISAEATTDKPLGDGKLGQGDENAKAQGETEPTKDTSSDGPTADKNAKNGDLAKTAQPDAEWLKEIADLKERLAKVEALPETRVPVLRAVGRGAQAQPPPQPPLNTETAVEYLRKVADDASVPYGVRRMARRFLNAASDDERQRALDGMSAIADARGAFQQQGKQTFG